jgi:hypothetical protein
MRHTFLLLFLLFARALFPSLPAETLIQTPDGLVQIQNLERGGDVLGFDLKTNQEVVTNIISISRLTVRKSVKVTTESDVFEISDDQLIQVERTQPHHEKLFIPAWFLKAGDLLQSKNSLQKCVRLEQINNCEEPFYELHLESPHHFFATNQGILMHNVVEGTAVFYLSTGAAESGLGSSLAKGFEAVAGPVVGLLVLFGTAVSMLYNTKDAPEPPPTIQAKTPGRQSYLSQQNNIIDRSPTVFTTKQRQGSREPLPIQPTNAPIITNEQEKDDAAQDEADFKIIREKINLFDKQFRKLLDDELLKGDREISPDDWFKPGGPGASPPNTNPADSLTFKDWTFLPQAFFGMSAYSLAPRLAVAALESALCMAGGTAALPTAVFMAPIAACAVAESGGICMLVDSARRMVLTVLKIAARVKNLLKARPDINTFEYTRPKSVSKSLKADAESKTVSKLADAKAETTTRTPTGGPEPPEDPEDEDALSAEDKKELKEIEDKIEDGTEQGQRDHINQNKHLWNKIGHDSKLRWPQMKKYFAKAISKGKTLPKDVNAPSNVIWKELQTKFGSIEVRYEHLSNDFFRIKTAFIRMSK